MGQEIKRIKSFESGKMMIRKERNPIVSPFEAKGSVDRGSHASCEANVETAEANSITTFNRKPSLAINRSNVFELNLKFGNL